MTVWIIFTDPQYEEHEQISVLEIFDSREKAELRIDSLNNSEFGENYYLWIEKWEVQ